MVIPRRFDERRVPGLVESHRDWIRRAATRTELRRLDASQSDPVCLPNRICAPAIGCEWSVQYRGTDSRRVAAVRRGSVVLVMGAVVESEGCRRALVRWLLRVAREYLPPMLGEVAACTGLSANRVTVKLQRTRWASCSRGGTISLNARLLFVAPELVRHVLIHELCHTVRMDHSAKFGELLEKHDPQWRAHRRLLRAAWKDAPGWLTKAITPQEVRGNVGEGL